MQTTGEMNIAMTPETLRAVRDSVEAGEYASASEALNDAVRLWQRQRIEHAESLKDIRSRVRRALDDPRPDLTFEEVENRLAKLHADTVDAHGDATN